jgi:hypothetical protein
MNMELRPLHNYRKAGYPTLDQYYAKKFRSETAKRAALAAALAALALLSGCFDIAS